MKLTRPKCPYDVIQIIMDDFLTELPDFPAEDIEQMLQDLPEFRDKDVSKSFDKFLNSTTDF